MTTEQELFEKDYLSAFGFDEDDADFSMTNGVYDDEAHYGAFCVWRQQAARQTLEAESLKATHAAEVAELVAALKRVKASIDGDYYMGQGWEREQISLIIGKLEGVKS